MHSTERRRQISSLIAVHGRATVTELSRRFNVTPETIRRDLTILDDEGLIYRVHGGAVPAQSYRTEVTPVDVRSKAALSAKEDIAVSAVDLIPQEGTTRLFIDAGTTTGMLARAIARQDRVAEDPVRDLPHLDIITNSLPIANLLADSPRCNVHLVGGHVRPLAEAIVGDVATRSLGVLRADIAFVGTNALTLDRGFSTPDAEEGAIKRAMITNASEVVALCDSTKFGLDYLVTFAALDDITHLVTDCQAPERYTGPLRESGVNVIIARQTHDVEDPYLPLSTADLSTPVDITPQ